VLSHWSKNRHVTLLCHKSDGRHVVPLGHIVTFLPLNSAYLMDTCPSKGVTKILQKGTIWGTVCFILLFDGTLQYLNRTNRSGLSFWLQWTMMLVRLEIQTTWFLFSRIIDNVEWMLKKLYVYMEQNTYRKQKKCNFHCNQKDKPDQFVRLRYCSVPSNNKIKQTVPQMVPFCRIFVTPFGIGGTRPFVRQKSVAWAKTMEATFLRETVMLVRLEIQTTWFTPYNRWV
jgi:hypothetical protein